MMFGPSFKRKADPAPPEALGVFQSTLTFPKHGKHNSSQNHPKQESSRKKEDIGTSEGLEKWQFFIRWRSTIWLFSSRVPCCVPTAFDGSSAWFACLAGLPHQDHLSYQSGPKKGQEPLHVGVSFMGSVWLWKRICVQVEDGLDL